MVFGELIASPSQVPFAIAVPTQNSAYSLAVSEKASGSPDTPGHCPAGQRPSPDTPGRSEKVPSPWDVPQKSLGRSAYTTITIKIRLRLTEGRGGGGAEPFGDEGAERLPEFGRRAIGGEAARQAGQAFFDRAG